MVIYRSCVTGAGIDVRCLGVGSTRGNTRSIGISVLLYELRLGLSSLTVQSLMFVTWMGMNRRENQVVT